MQGVHESSGVSGDYLRLEALIQKVVSPYLGTHGLFCRDGSSGSHCSSCLLGTTEVTPHVLGHVTRDHLSSPACHPTETCLQRSCSPAAKNTVVRSKSYNVPLLTPVVENDPDGGGCGGAMGIRRHSVCEMTSCVEESTAPAETTAGGNSTNESSAPHSGGQPIRELERGFLSVP